MTGLKTRTIVLLLTLCAPALPQHREMTVHATAYSMRGRTASGAKAERGIIAADPKVLPLGSKVKITGAGPYSGHYTVADTGKRIRGRQIDVFLPSQREAKQFGRRKLRIALVETPRRGA